MKIGLLSDSHGYMSPEILKQLVDCDEIWHAGDIGSMKVIEAMETLNKPLRVVHGNIDAKELKWTYPEDLFFELNGIKVFMTHIGGYPPRYVSRVRDRLVELRPDLYVCGHSHILKVMPDRDLKLLHMNPGAIGHHGIHHIRTLLTFHIINHKIEQVCVVELGRRGIK